MGAHDISFTLHKKASFSEIKNALKERQQLDSEENGHRDGYSGDFQTIQEVTDRTDKIFDTYSEAHDFCMKNSQKWENVVAVYYKYVQIKPTKRSQKVSNKLADMLTQLNALESQGVKLPKFVTCEGCSSKVSTEHFKGLKCPICREGDFRPLTLQRKITKLKTRIISLKDKLNGIINATKQKAVSKATDKNIRTLVAGWGAC